MSASGSCAEVSAIFKREVSHSLVLLSGVWFCRLVENTCKSHCF